MTEFSFLCLSKHVWRSFFCGTQKTEWFCPNNESQWSLKQYWTSLTHCIYKKHWDRVRVNCQNFHLWVKYSFKNSKQLWTHGLLQSKIALLQYQMQYVPNTWDSTWVFAVPGGDPQWLYGAWGSRRVCVWVWVLLQCHSMACWSPGAVLAGHSLTDTHLLWHFLPTLTEKNTWQYLSAESHGTVVLLSCSLPNSFKGIVHANLKLCHYFPLMLF